MIDEAVSVIWHLSECVSSDYCKGDAHLCIPCERADEGVQGVLQTLYLALNHQEPWFYYCLVLFLVGRRSHRLRAGVWGTAGGDHLPWGVARGQNHHELPCPGQPTCHIQVTYAPSEAPCLHRLMPAKTRSTSERLLFKHLHTSEMRFSSRNVSFHIFHGFIYSFSISIWGHSQMFSARKRTCFAHSVRFYLKIKQTGSNKEMWWYFI